MRIYSLILFTFLLTRLASAAPFESWRCGYSSGGGGGGSSFGLELKRVPGSDFYAAAYTETNWIKHGPTTKTTKEGVVRVVASSKDNRLVLRAERISGDLPDRLESSMTKEFEGLFSRYRVAVRGNDTVYFTAWLTSDLTSGTCEIDGKRPGPSDLGQMVLNGPFPAFTFSGLSCRSQAAELDLRCEGGCKSGSPFTATAKQPGSEAATMSGFIHGGKDNAIGLVSYEHGVFTLKGIKREALDAQGNAGITSLVELSLNNFLAKKIEATFRFPEECELDKKGDFP